MDVSVVSRALDALLGCSKRDKKTKLSMLMHALQSTKVRFALSHNDELRHKDEICHLFGWNALLAGVLTSVMDEARACSKSVRGDTKSTPELSAYFKLLNVVLTHGCHGNHPLELDDLVRSFLYCMRNLTCLDIQQHFFTSIRVLFHHCNSHSLKLDYSLWDDLVFWCCNEFKGNSLHSSSYLLCLLLSHASSTAMLPLTHIFNALITFLKRSFQPSVTANKPNLVINVGWAVHLVRWFIAHVYVSFSDWSKVAIIFDSLMPSMLLFLTELGAIVAKLPTGQLELLKLSAPPKSHHSRDAPQVFALLQESEETETMESKHSLAPSVTSTLRQIYSVHPRNCTYEEPRSQSYILGSVRQLPVGLINIHSYFSIESIPELCRSPCFGHPMLAPEDLVVSDELFALWRWLLVFSYHHSAPPIPDMYNISSSSLSTLLRYLFQEWNHLVTRIGFQNEATTWRQLRALHNYFGLFAAALILVYDEHAAIESRLPLLLLVEELVPTLPSRSDSDANCKRSRVFEEGIQADPKHESLWSLLTHLVSWDDKGGPFWWLVLDWAVRLKWQHSMFGEQCSMQTALSGLLEKVPSCFGRAKTPLAYECLLIALHTLVAILHSELSRGMQETWKPTNAFLQAVQQCFAEVLRISVLSTGSRDPNRPGRGDGSASKARLRTQDRLAHELLSNLLRIATLPKLQAYFGNLRRVFSHQLEVHFNKFYNTCPDYFTHPVLWRLRFFVFCGHLLPELHLSQLCISIDSKALTAFNPFLYFFLTHLTATPTSMDEESIVDHDAPLKRLFSLLCGIYWSCVLTFHNSSSCDRLQWLHWQLSDGTVVHQTVALSGQQLLTAIDHICQVLSEHPLLLESCQLALTPFAINTRILLLIIWSHLVHVKAHLLRLDHTAFENLIPSSLVETLFLHILKLLLTNSRSSKKRVDLKSDTVQFADQSSQLWLSRSLSVMLKHLSNEDFIRGNVVHSYWEKLVDRIVQKPLPLCLKPKSSAEACQVPSRSTAFSRFGDDEFIDCGLAPVANIEPHTDEDSEEQLIESEKREQETNLLLWSSVLSYALRTRSTNLLQLLRCQLSQVLCNLTCDTAESIDWLCLLVDEVTTHTEQLSTCSLMPPRLDVAFEEALILLLSCLVDAVRESFKARLARSSRVKCITQLLQLIYSSCQLIQCVERRVNNAMKPTALESSTLQRWYAIGQHLDQLSRTVWSVTAKYGAHLLYGLGQVAVDCVQSWFKLHSSGIIDTHTTPEYCLSTLLQHSVVPIVLRLAEFLENLARNSLDQSWSKRNSKSLVLLLNSILDLLARRPISLESCFSTTDPDSSSSLDAILYIHQLIHSILFSLSGIRSCDPEANEPRNKRPNLMTLRSQLSCFVQSCLQLTDLCSTSVRGSCEKVFQILSGATLAYAGSAMFKFQVRPYLLPLVLTEWLQTKAASEPDILKRLRQFPWKAWGFDDWVEKCNSPQADLVFNVLSSPLIGADPALTNTTCAPSSDNVPLAVSTLVFHEHCSAGIGSFHLTAWWSVLQRQAGGLEVIRQVVAEPSTVTSIVEHTLRLLAMYQSSDSSTSDATPSYELPSSPCRELVLCLCRIATRLEFVNNNPFGSKLPSDSITPFIPILCSLFDSKSELPHQIEHLLKLSVEIASSRRTNSNSVDILFPRSHRLSSWMAVCNLIVLILFHPASPYSAAFCQVELKDFTFWRLVVGHLQLMAMDSTNSFSTTLNLLSSLDTLLFLTRSHVYAQRDVQMEVTLHHATVAHLVGMAMQLIESQHNPRGNDSVDPCKVEKFQLILDRISATLTSLVGPDALPRFQSAVCQLPDFPNGDFPQPWSSEAAEFFKKHQQLVKNVCTCDRANPYQTIKLYSSYFENLKFLRCPLLLRYQNWNLNRLQNLLLKLITPSTEVPSIDQLEFSIGARSTQLQQTASNLCQFFNTPSHEISTILMTLYEQISYTLFPTGSESFRVEIDAALTDHATRAAGLKCFAVLKRLVRLLNQMEVEMQESWALKGESSAGSAELSTQDPTAKAAWRCVLGTAHLASFADSASASVACKVLHQLFSDCSSSLDAFLSSGQPSTFGVSVSTILLPYLSVQNSKRTGPNIKETQLTLFKQLSELSHAELVQFATRHVKRVLLTCSSDVESARTWPLHLINWILDLPLVINPVYTTLQPLLPFSPSLCKHILPWLLVSVFSSTDSQSADVTRALKLGVADGIAWCLQQSSISSTIQNLWIDSLLALHSWDQWTRTNGNRSSQPSNVFSDWLIAADCAVTLNRPYAARLFMELAWLNDNSPPDWVTMHPARRRVWLGICRLFSDLPGLRAAQVAFLTPCQSTDDFDTETLSSDLSTSLVLKETSVAVNELCNNWDRLLAWYDASLPKCPSARLDLATCLHRMAAYNLAQCAFDENGVKTKLQIAEPVPALQNTSDEYFSRLQEMRSASAWRLGNWDELEKKNTGDESLKQSAIAVSPPTDWSDCGMETSFYWIVEAAHRHDWPQVATIASHLWRSSLDDLEKQLSTNCTFYSEISSTTHRVSCLENFMNVIGCLQSVDVNNHNQLAHVLLRCSVKVLDEISHMIDSVTSSSYLIDSFTVMGSLESFEPFVTSSLRLVSSLLTQLLSDSDIPGSRAFSLLQHAYFEVAEGALMTGELRLVEQWLQNAAVCEDTTSRPGALRLPIGEQTILLSRTWRQLRSVELMAQLNRCRGEQHISVSHLQTGLEIARRVLELSLEHSDPLIRRGLVSAYMHGVTTLCSWMFTSRSKSAGDLLTNYLDPAMSVARRWEVTVDPEALASVAQFADAQFTALDSYLSSSEFATRRQLLVEAQRDVDCLTDLGEKSRLLRILQRQSALEVEELEALTSDADRYLEAALDAYAQCLATSDAHDLQIYRLISLWFSAAADPSVQSYPTARAQTVNRIMAERLSAIRSDKFLPLIPQLAVRLSCAHSNSGESAVGFQAILTELVERIVDWHPHHAAFMLLFLVNAELDDVYTSNPATGVQRPTSMAQRSRQARMNATSKLNDSENKLQQTAEQNSRIQAARRMYARLVEGRRGHLLQQMQTLAEAYVEWANANVDKHRGSTSEIPFPSGCQLQRFTISSRQRGNIRQDTDALSMVAMPTDVLRIDRSGQYDNSKVVCIAGFAPTFRLVGGINMPKIVTCWGTDGRSRRQLVKGKDDPRQDAVMQQVFAAANRLLYQRRCRSRAHIEVVNKGTTSCDSTSRRCKWLDADGGLRVRTYKVIPMAQRSGVIEWCEGTVPLGEWLAADRSGAHQRYRPKDLPPGQAKQRLAAVRDRPPERRLVVFEEICQKLNPVLAYFYLEHFPDPQQWCRARYAYTRSLAASSLVGYLVGLGDRHPHNLLLHRASGELIHIDLGVAFDQGRLLPTPEMVPFRLTRDLVHALGPLGLEAGFTPAAETVLSELRDGGDVILTLLQVLLYDPLYSWSMTPAQLCALEARRAEYASTVGQGKSGNSILSDQTNIPGQPGKALVNATKGTDLVNRSLLNTSLECGASRFEQTREPLNQLAERVLLNVRSKLEGRVTGNLASTSSDQRKCGGLDQLDVSGHVGMLVRAATDRTQLARMYFGWQAYL